MKPNTVEEKFKNLESGEENVKLEWFGKRHTLALMCFLGYTTITSMRVCLNVAIVKMVSHSFAQNQTLYINQFQNQSYLNSSLQNSTYQVETFAWSEGTVEQILGSFYYGYAISNMIGGAVADYWGAKYTFGIAVLLSSFMTILSPFASQVSSDLLIATRIFQGFLDGIGFPGTNTLMAKWFPNNERTKVISYVFSGAPFGSVFSMSLTGLICSSEYLGGWRTVFFFFGSVGLLWSIVWFIVIYEEPLKHPKISDAELQYINNSCYVTKKRSSIPWKHILTSVQFWISVFAGFGSKWCFYTILTQLPIYFDSSYHFKMKNNGWISALPFLGSWTVSLVYGYLVFKLLDKKIISLLGVRRLSMVIGGFLPAFGFLILALVTVDASAGVCIFIFLLSSTGTQNCGFACSFSDIAPRFAGTMYGISTTVGSTAGFLSPLLASILHANWETSFAWKGVFLNTCFIYGISSAIYVIFIKTETQPWNEVDEKEEKK